MPDCRILVQIKVVTYCFEYARLFITLELCRTLGSGMRNSCARLSFPVGFGRLWSWVWNASQGLTIRTTKSAVQYNSVFRSSQMTFTSCTLKQVCLTNAQSAPARPKLDPCSGYGNLKWHGLCCVLECAL